MPGFCAIVGCAKSNEVAVKIVRELQKPRHPHLPQRQRQRAQHHPPVSGRGRPARLRYLHRALRHRHHLGRLRPRLRHPLRPDLRRHGGGQARDIMLYNKDRVFAFVLALGEVTTTSTRRPPAPSTTASRSSPTPTSRRSCRPASHLRARRLMPLTNSRRRRHGGRKQRLLEVRGFKIKVAKVPIPVPYGPAFEGERVRKEDMHVEFGGKTRPRFEYLQHARARRGRGRQDQGRRPRDRRRRAEGGACRSPSWWRSPAARCRRTSSRSSSARSTT